MINQMLKMQINKLPLHNNLNQALSVKQRVGIHESSKKLIRPVVHDIIKANQRTGEFKFPFRGPCSLHLEFVFGEGRRHDWDNLVTDHKPWQDCMVQMGLLNDDSQIDEAHILVARYQTGPKTLITLVEKGG